MAQVIEPLNENDADRIRQHRDWVVGHFDDAAAYGSVAGKLRVIQAILDNGWIAKHETWKLQSLGVAFGDALVEEVPELSWVAVDDEFGRDPALRWLQTNTLAFPLTAVSKRVEDGVAVDVYEMFGGFQKAIKEALARSLMTERDTVPAVKDDQAPHPVAGAWRGPLREVVRAFMLGDYSLAQGVASVEAVDPRSAEHIREYIADYGATLVELPDEAWNTSIAQWQGSHWQVLVDLWTAEEGRSDLVLECRVYEAGDGYRIAVHLVYVP